MMKKLLLTLALSTLPFLTVAADIEAGKAKSVTCAACHGPAGISIIPTYPNLAGQKEQYLVKQLKDFRAKIRKDPVMSGMAASLSDQDIENLAAYYASLKAN